MPAQWPLIGHQEAATALQDAIARGRLAHAYLFAGPPGVGKTTLALTLAQALNCLQRSGRRGTAEASAAAAQDPAACGVCSSCRRIAAGNHADVMQIAPEAGQRELGIDRVRELTRLVKLRPYEGGWRMLVLPEADRLTHEAANALLKLLEEPPPETVFVLTTGAEAGVLTTIRSRCQVLQLHRVPTQTIEESIRERFGLPQDQAGALAAFAQGCPGVALALAQHPESAEEVQAGLDRLRDLVDAPLPERLDIATSLLDGSEGNRNMALGLLSRWEVWWRDLLLVQQGCSHGIIYLLQEEAYRRYAAAFTLGELRRALGVIRSARRRLEQNAIPRLVLDVLAVELPFPGGA